MKINNINEYIRMFLLSKMNDILKEGTPLTEAVLRYNDEILKLKENESFYKLVVGLCFADAYQSLVYRSRYGTIKEEEKERLEYFSTIKDLDDLLFQIDDNLEILFYILMIPFKYNRLPRFTKDEVLLIEEERIIPFAPFHNLEKLKLFEDTSLDELISLYKNTQAKYKQSGLSNRTSSDYGNDEVMHKLKLLRQGNISNYKQLVIPMLFHYYKCKKAIKVLSNSLAIQEEAIIDLIENNDILEVLTYLQDRSVFRDIVEEYTNYAVRFSAVDEDILNSIYADVIPEKVKEKIKESLR